MATFYVMDPKQKHTYTQVLDGLLSHQTYFVDYIKNNQFEEEELAGLKLFLENNNYNIKLLKQFIEPPALNPQTKKQTSVGNYYKIAAGIVLIISLGFLVKFTFADKSTAINNYWIEDPGFKVWMGPSDKSMLLQNGMSYYRAEDYKLALEQFVKIIQNDTALYYSGICFIKQNELDSAENYFKQLLPTSVYKNKASFYLALCYLSNHKTNEAIILLNNTTFTESDFEVKRKKIIHDLTTTH
jgi:TolA-binding protein